MDAALTERSIEVGGIRTFVRERTGEGAPVVFVHGNPASSADWLPFIERVGGPAIAFDLPGFGRSERPDRTGFDHSIAAYADFAEGLLDELAPGGYRLVVHDWGSLALVAAQRHPERLERLVAINAVPLSAAYRWHWVARIWRRRGLGEAFNALSTRTGIAQLLRLANPGRRAMPRETVDRIWSDWDAGMRRAVLGLYRSADPGVLGAAGSRLGLLGCPALVAWGVGDPFIGAEQGRWFASILPDAVLVELDGAGHWPWIDRPELIDRVAGFLGERA